MRVPGCERAVVPRAKMIDYLLSVGHPGGRSKARWFMGFGFRPEEWGQLADALKRHAESHEVTRIEDSPFGKRFVVDGPLESPDGRRPGVRVVWFVETGDDVPRFVTAFPLTGSRR